MAQLLTHEEYEAIRDDAERVVGRILNTRPASDGMNRVFVPSEKERECLINEQIGARVVAHFREVEHTLWDDLREIGKDIIRDLRGR